VTVVIAIPEVPVTTRTPGVFAQIDSTQAQQGTAVKPYRALILGQRRSTGTVDALVAMRCTSHKQAQTFFGIDSQLALMAEAWFSVNRSTEMWMLALEDSGSGVPAVGSFTITASGPQSGQIYAYVAGRRYTVAVTTASTQNALATSLASAINADASCPVSAGAASNVVNLTAKQVGTVGNDCDLRVNYGDGEQTAVGVTVGITNMQSGSGDVDVSTAWAVLKDVQYDVIVAPFTDSTNLASLEAELSSRWGAMRETEGVAIAGFNGNFSATAALGASRNSKHSSILTTSRFPRPSYVVASRAAGLVAFYGAADPARPFQTLELTGELPPAPADQFTQEERNLLLFDGISTLKVGAGGVVQIERMIMTYQVNPAGAEDTAFLDMTTPLTLSQLRWSWRQRMLLRFPRHKRAADGTRAGAGSAVVTPSMVRAENVSLFREWEEQGWVQDAASFIRLQAVELNPQDPTRLDVLLPPTLVSPLIIMAGNIQFRL
jgi:phage tail sheath gpL-like